MASASVADLGDCAAFTRLSDGKPVVTLGSLGRFRANGPIAAHPTFRMHRIPPGVVLANLAVLNQTRGDTILFPGSFARRPAFAGWTYLFSPDWGHSSMADQALREGQLFRFGDTHLGTESGLEDL